MSAMLFCLLLALIAIIWQVLRALLVAEAVGWIPGHCKRTIERAVKWLPPEEWEFHRELWGGELAACKDRPLTALWWAHVVVRRGCAARLREIAVAKKGEEGGWHPSSRLGLRIYRRIDGLLEAWEVQVAVWWFNSSAYRPESEFSERMISSVMARIRNGGGVWLHPELKREVRLDRSRFLVEMLTTMEKDDPRWIHLVAEYEQLQRLIQSDPSRLGRQRT